MIDKKKVEEAIALLLAGIGEDGEREGLRETPQRIARMYEEILHGMEEDAATHLAKTFAAADNEMVVMRDIVFYSVCEHHMMPFFGKAHVAYIPDGRVVGLSKLARTVEVYARRLQLQERMTAQIAEAIMTHLQPRGVMVMVEAEHLCVTMRGVMKPGNQTITTVMKGAFIDNERLQEMFYNMVKG
jgi:GTP cyclohydrolase I